MQVPMYWGVLLLVEKIVNLLFLDLERVAFYVMTRVIVKRSLAFVDATPNITVFQS